MPHTVHRLLVSLTSFTTSITRAAVDVAEVGVSAGIARRRVGGVQCAQPSNAPDV